MVVNGLPFKKAAILPPGEWQEAGIKIQKFFIASPLPGPHPEGEGVYGRARIVACGLQITPQVLRSMITAAMVAAQVTGDKRIPGVSGQVMFAAAAFNVLYVVTQGTHRPAD